MSMNPKIQKLAKAAFAQGIKDEDENKYFEVARLKIDYRVRDFYDAARRQRAEQLLPARELAEAEKLKQEKIRVAEVEARLIAVIPKIKKELAKNNGIVALRLVMNAEIGI